MQRELFYYLSHIHIKLYFLQGNIETNDYKALLPKMKSETGDDLISFAYQMRDISLDQFAIKDARDNSFLQELLLKYINLLKFISYKTTKNLSIGIDLAADPIDVEVLTHMLISNIKHINGIQVEKYQENKKYDFILTNKAQKKKDDYKNAEVYILSEVLSAFDMKNIEELIKRLNQ